MLNHDSTASTPLPAAETVSAKKHLRAQGRAIRTALGTAERAAASAQICAHLRQFFEENPAENLAVYLATLGEANLDELIAWLLARRMPVFAPRGEVFAPLESLDAVRVGPWGLREPEAEGVEGEHTTILVPGLLFDRHGGRLGFGGGWYDRTLARFPQALKIGVAFSEQIVDEVPREAHDILMNLIATPHTLHSAHL